MPRWIIIDTDPGTDDAVAILLALGSPELEVIAICAVAGNVPLAQTERNARAICELAGRGDIPVHAGCPRAVGVTATPSADGIHGGQGLGGLVLAAPRPASRAPHAVRFLRQRPP